MLQLDLNDPSHAREYIATFKVNGKKLDCVTLNSGREIVFASMNDDDAVLVANLLYEIELEAELDAAKREGKLQ